MAGPRSPSKIAGCPAAPSAHARLEGGRAISPSAAIRTCWRRSSRTRRTSPAVTRPAWSSPRTKPTSPRRCADRAAVLPIGAQSSLTGGATPRGELLVSTRALNRILDIGRPSRCASRRASTLAELDAALEPLGRYYPPAPTFTGAFVGGTIATNAAGAATFKYGTTRDWVEALTVVLPTGDVLDVERGDDLRPRRRLLRDRAARSDGHACRCRPTACRACRRLSAGYFAAPHMDLIDLFIGAEGTLGVITEVDPARAAVAPRDVPRVRAVQRSRRRARLRASASAIRRPRRGARAARAA